MARGSAKPWECDTGLERLSDIESFVATRWAERRRADWQMAGALLLARAHHRYRDAGYASWTTWVRDRLPIAVGTASRLVTALWRVLELPADRQDLFVGVSPERAYLVRDLIRSDPVEAARLAGSTRPAAEIEEEVSRLVGSHREPLTRRIVLKVTPGVFEQWRRAYNLVRVHCGVQGTAYPSDSEVVEMMATVVLQAPELTNMEPELLEEVCAGTVACSRCQSVAGLQRHHVVPRSHGGVDAHGDEQLRWLCAACHRHLHDRLGEDWRAFADRAGVSVPGWGGPHGSDSTEVSQTASVPAGRSARE